MVRRTIHARKKREFERGTKTLTTYIIYYFRLIVMSIFNP